MKLLAIVIPVVFLSVSQATSLENVISVESEAEARNRPASSSAGNVVVNVYSKPGSAESIVSSASSAGSQAVASIRDRINAVAQRFPTVPPLKLPPLPTLPSIPSKVKVPVRVGVETQTITFPTPPKFPTLPPLPTLPPVKLPQKVIVGTMEVARPQLPSFSGISGLKPVEIVYEDVKPPTLFKPAPPPVTEAPSPCYQGK